MRKKISILILLSSFISSITFSTVRSETDTTSILVLNSYHHGYQWTDDVLEGFLSQFPENDPIVFCGINQFSPSLITGMNDITGVVEDHDIKQTLNLALSLHPDTKTIAVVCDSSIIFNCTRGPQRARV
jgi:ABC-type uncharacterized transport system substrate-binding protein